MFEKRTMFPLPDKMKGVEVSLTAVDTETSTIPLKKSDGKVIGISVAQKYTSAQWAGVLVSVLKGENVYLESVPADQLIPSGEKLYYPFKEPIDADGELEIKLDDTETSGIATFEDKTVFVLHFMSEKNCKG